VSTHYAGSRCVRSKARRGQGSAAWRRLHEALAYSQKLIKERGWSTFHPYDDPDTIGWAWHLSQWKFCRQQSRADGCDLYCGRGGLDTPAIAAYVKYRARIQGDWVEPRSRPGLRHAMDAGRAGWCSARVGLLAAVLRGGAESGEHTFRGMSRTIVGR